MNRRKKLPTARVATGPPPMQDVRERCQAGCDPKPSAPNKVFLAVTTVLLMLWIIFLIVLAATS